MNPIARALIAEDEPLLRQALEQALARAWPGLEIVASVGDGLSAVREALALRPDVLFFDIRMPGLSGLEAAAALAEAWPEGAPFPALVMVTAYDQYAVQAFDAQAIDYLLKPLQPARLQQTVERLQRLRAVPGHGGSARQDLESVMAQLRQLLPDAPPAPARPAPLLTMIQAGAGAQIQLVPVHEVLYFEAADKYVRVLTAQHEYLIRMPLKDLIARLDPAQFWQIHRGTLVRATAIAAARRDGDGRLRLHLRGRPEALAVSRVYAHLFKAM